MQEKDTSTQYQTHYENCISEPIQSDMMSQYFQRQKTQHTTNHHMNNNPERKYEEQVNEKLCRMIQKGTLFIPQQQKKLKFQQKIKSKSECSEIILHQKLKKLQQKKHQARQQLKKLQKDELQIKRFSIQMKKSKIGLSKLSRSFFMKEQKQKIKQIIIQNCQLQNQLKQKTKQAIQRYYEEIKAEKQQQVNQKQSLRNKKKQEVKHFLQSLKLKKQQRKTFLQKTNKNYQNLKHKKYLFVLKQEQDQINNKEKQFEQKQKINQIKRKMKMKTLQNIQQHQSRYSDILRQKKQQRLSKSRIIHENFIKQNTARTNIESTYFSHLVKNQIAKIKQQNQEKKRKSLQFKQKLINYKDHLDNNIRPKIKITQQSSFVSDKKVHSVHSLNYQQQRNKGIQFLGIAKKLKKYECPQEQNAIKNFPLQKKTTYKNYLQEMRKFSQHSATQNSQNNSFKKLMQKDEKIISYNNLNKAFLKVEEMSAKSKKSNDQKLIDTVQTKINLLKMIVL